MSSYKVIDSTISILYCAKCANEHLEVVSPGRLVCPDCSTVSTFDPAVIRIGQLAGTKYKMRDSRRYSFREIIDEARQSAFSDVYVPSPEPGRKRTGWRSEEKEASPEEGQIRLAGVEDNQSGWRNDTSLDLMADEQNEQEHNDDPTRNGRDDACPV